MRSIFGGRMVRRTNDSASWTPSAKTSAPFKGKHRAPMSRRSKILAGVVGAMMTAGIAAAASNWAVGLTAGSTASAQAASITNLTITQVTPVATLTNQLYPAGSGDVMLTISNPNPFPVTITGRDHCGRSVWPGQQPAYGDFLERGNDGRKRPGCVCRSVLLDAFPHRDHGNRWGSDGDNLSDC
jgi:hypothetical protein